MKHFNSFSRALCLAAFIIMTASAHAQTFPSQGAHMDSVEISLLTCSPGNEVWSLYGHSAIRIQDKSNGEDVAVNYGLFDYNQKNFIIRFIFGLTDYSVGIAPFPMFLTEYARQGRTVVQQRLNLSPEEKTYIIQAIAENCSPANRIYRYNYFYDNCTTRARDMLVNHLSGKVVYVGRTNLRCSYRGMVHQWTENHRWARFGKDLLLGVKADMRNDFAARQFLPDSLRADFEHAIVLEPTHQKHALVDSTFEVLKGNTQNSTTEQSVWDNISPRMLFAILAVIIFLTTAYECYRRKTFWLIDVILLTLDGIPGLILFAMIFSKHPTVSLNLQILLLNPLSIIFVYSVAKKAAKHKYHWFWNVLGVCVILFFIGSVFQNYAEGMNFLALTLLVRVVTNRFIYKYPTLKT